MKVVIFFCLLVLVLMGIAEALRGNSPAKEEEERQTQPIGFILLWIYRLVTKFLSHFFQFIRNVITFIFLFFTSSLGTTTSTTMMTTTTTMTTMTTSMSTAPQTTMPIITSSSAMITPSEPMTTASQTTAPQTTAPQTTAPQTTAPQTTALQTTATQTTAPQTTALQTTAPQTTASQTTASQTTASSATTSAMAISTSMSSTALSTTTSSTTTLLTTTSSTTTSSTTTPTPKTVFISSTTSTGNLGGIEGADNTCATLAMSAGLNGTFLSWLTNASTSPAMRFDQSLGPYVLTNDNTFAMSFSALTSGSPLVVLNRDETNALQDSMVWTGTDDQGNPRTDGTCLDWTNDLLPTIVGGTGGTESAVTWTVEGTLPCSNQFRIYCFQQ